MQRENTKSLDQISTLRDIIYINMQVEQKIIKTDIISHTKRTRKEIRRLYDISYFLYQH